MADNLADIVINSTESTISSGRRHWEVSGPDAAGQLIRAFAVAGYDVLKTYNVNGSFTVDANAGGHEIVGSRDVRLDGRQVAWILWHPDVPDFACATTYAA